MNKYADEFYATFQELARKYSAEKVWQDVIYACALTQSVFLREWDTKARKNIDKVMEQYSEKEQYKIMSLYANIMDALQENPGQDFLGEMYHRLDLQKHEKGQFFTPAYNVYHWHYERYHIGEGTDLKTAVNEESGGKV